MIVEYPGKQHAFCKPAVINNKFHVDVILMVAAKFAYSFQGVKGHPSSYGTWKTPRTGSESKAN